MKRKIWLGILFALCVSATCFALASCKDGDGTPTNGVDGKSAYELYCQAYPDYTGTMEEWLASLKGDKGDMGAQGVKGDTGEQGVKGDTGAGIASAVVSEDGQLVITLTDGTVLPAIDLPTAGGNLEALESLRFQKVADKEEYRVMGMGTVSSLDIVIPETYRGLPVTEIGAYAFMDETYIQSVTIPDSVLSIGNYAFSNCIALTSVVIPDSVMSIGDQAFYKCTSLTSVEIGDSVMSIGSSAFFGCYALTSVVIGDSVMSIGPDAFSYCSALTSVVIPDSVMRIGWDAFKNCTSLTSIIIPDSVTSIGQDAFLWCSALTIYCEAESEPEGWHSDWNPHDCPVVWGYKGE